jgi:flagellar basal-body rod protein FlgB
MSTTIEVLKKLLDVSAVRHEVLAHNLANATTPGYRRQDVAFRDALTQAIGKNDADAVSKVQATVQTDYSAPVDGRGNSVSMHLEMSALQENSMLYGMSAQILNRKYARLQSAIKGQ